MEYRSESEETTLALGAQLARRLVPGDTVLFYGELGAGKTTMIRGLLRALGHEDPVRSPTFNLIQTFPTNPPVMHADLYRLRSADGIGLDDYAETHISLIEWPTRLGPLLDQEACYRVTIEFEDASRIIHIEPPLSS